MIGAICYQAENDRAYATKLQMIGANATKQQMIGPYAAKLKMIGHMLPSSK